MEALLIQLLGNSPTLIAVLLIYHKLDRRILTLEIERNKKHGKVK